MELDKSFFGQITNSKGTCIGMYVPSMTTTCIHCKVPITVDDGMFIVLASPYYGCLHRRCAPHFSFNGNWPHAFPAAVYNNLGGDSKWPVIPNQM